MWTNMKHFFWRTWQRILPLVYDDSLSLYEVMSKLVYQFNKVIDRVNEFGDGLKDIFEAYDKGELKGDKGDTGPVGPRGPAGPEGPQGPQGVAGKDGTSFTVSGEVGSVEELPASAETGIAYAVGDGYPYDIYIYDGSNWINLGPIEGPQGPQGEQGAQGEQGETGATGAQGPIGPTGATGPAGVTFTPSVSSEGIISWTNNGGLPNPEPTNIRGPSGQPVDSFTGKVYVTLLEPETAEDGSLWVFTEGTLNRLFIGEIGSGYVEGDVIVVPSTNGFYPFKGGDYSVYPLEVGYCNSLGEITYPKFYTYNGSSGEWVEGVIWLIHNGVVSGDFSAKTNNGPLIGEFELTHKSSGGDFLTYYLDSQSSRTNTFAYLDRANDGTYDVHVTGDVRLTDETDKFTIGAGYVDSTSIPGGTIAIQATGMTIEETSGRVDISTAGDGGSNPKRWCFWYSIAAQEGSRAYNIENLYLVRVR